MEGRLEEPVAGWSKLKVQDFEPELKIMEVQILIYDLDLEVFISDVHFVPYWFSPFLCPSLNPRTDPQSCRQSKFTQEIGLSLTDILLEIIVRSVGIYEFQAWPRFSALNTNKHWIR